MDKLNQWAEERWRPCTKQLSFSGAKISLGGVEVGVLVGEEGQLPP